MADRVAQRIEDALNTGGAVPAAALVAAGGAVRDGLAGATARLPGLRVAAGWLGRVIAALLALLGATVQAVANLLGIGPAGLVRLVAGGAAAGPHRVTSVRLRGLHDWAFGLTGSLLLVTGHLLGLVQTALGLQRERGLTPAETELVRRVFRTSLDPRTVRLVPGFAGLLSLNGRAVTLGSTVYLKSFDPAQRPDVLVHECTHVWQYRHVGSRYATEAAAAQLAVRDAYDWRAERARGHTTWPQLNREAQAELVQDAFRYGRGADGSDAPGAFYAADPVDPHARLVHADGADDSADAGAHDSAFARACVAQLRAGRP